MMIIRNFQTAFWRGLSAVLLLLTPVSAMAQSDAELLDIAQTAFDEQEYDAAFEIWTPLADKGNIDAQLALGDAALNCFCDLEDGTNIAFKYYRMAAEKGNAYGLRQMGYIYRYMGEDKDEAAIYYKAAADKGDVESQIELGDLYSDGIGGAVTLKLSPQYYLMAAAQGDGRGYSRMGRLYATGGPIKADLSKAYIAQSIAAALSFPLAKEKAAEAAKKLSAKQLVKANVLVAKCVKAKFFKCL
jgi:TPR repeat protein